MINNSLLKSSNFTTSGDSIRFCFKLSVSNGIISLLLPSEKNEHYRIYLKYIFISKSYTASGNSSSSSNNSNYNNINNV